ncbi:hypothetical protein E2562_017446 [Oryza meyeriana var. granulata]|uniref:Uncharacterized protein n=1 Tax=Oryza meyeriana var. granulata TaxID=110450 RepID=A0A6G1DXR8_9ORYZ|nr:hypothetical protein E2562_017446 [Oryza meyeriana var. granulata]
MEDCWRVIAWHDEYLARWIANAEPTQVVEHIALSYYHRAPKPWGHQGHPWAVEHMTQALVYQAPIY